MDKENAKRIKKFIALTLSREWAPWKSLEFAKDLDWLANYALNLEKPDIKVGKRKDLDKPEKNLKGKKRGS